MKKYILIPFEKYQRLIDENAAEKTESGCRDNTETTPSESGSTTHTDKHCNTVESIDCNDKQPGTVESSANNLTEQENEYSDVSQQGQGGSSSELPPPGIPDNKVKPKSVFKAKHSDKKHLDWKSIWMRY